MTATLISQPLIPASRGFDIGAITRALVILAGGAMTGLCLFAVGRAVLGFTPDLPHLRNIAVAFHVATVLPCVPLAIWLLLARKGTALHKQLGKLWLALMVITATATLFIYNGTQFSWLHVFVPVTYHAAWKIVRSARRGDMQSHKLNILGLFFGALMLPGVWAFLGEGRLMNVMLLG